MISCVWRGCVMKRWHMFFLIDGVTRIMIACQGWHCTWNYRIWQNHSQGAVLDVTGWYTLDIGNAEFFEHGMILHSGPERAHVFLLVLQFYAEAYCILLHVPGSKTKVTKGSQVCNMMQHSMVRRRRVSRRFPPRLSSRPDWLWWAKIKEGRKSSLDQVNTPSYTLALASKKCFGRFQHWGKLDPPNLWIPQNWLWLRFHIQGGLGNFDFWSFCLSRPRHSILCGSRMSVLSCDVMCIRNAKERVPNEQIT